MSEKATITKQSDDGEVSETAAREKLAQIEQEKIRDFLAKFEALSVETGLTFGAQVMVTHDGRLAANVIPVRRQNQ